MPAQRLYRSLIGYLCTFVLVAFVAGCGGGSGTSSNGNTPPAALAPSVTADPGDIVAVRVGQVATLDGNRSSTTTTNSLTFAWSISSKPDGSTAVLLNPTSPNPSFVTDVTGTYRVQLVVSAGNLTSLRTIALVEVTNPGDYLTGIRDHTSFTAQCADCHDGRFAQGDGPIDPVPTKIGNHPAASNLCQGCHTTFGFNLLPAVDHQEVFANCSTCHNGTIAIGKSEFHVPTTAECDSCHTTTAFVELQPDGTYDHTGITSGCVRCHNGITARGKDSDPTPPHPVTTSDCSACHTTTAFTPAYPDHIASTEVLNNRCDACHNSTGGYMGFIGRDQPAGHPVMTRTDMNKEDCGTCHSIRDFNMAGIFSHRVVDPTILPCSTCHNDNNSINARGKASDPTPPHPPTTTDCAACHNTTGFLPAFTIDHTEPAVVAARCDSCHGVTASGVSANHMPFTTEDCEVCHSPPGGGTFATGFFNHSPAIVDPVRCDSCHDDVITAGKSVNHVPTTDDCRVCHTGTTTFVGAVFNHGAVTSGCTTCHDGTIALGKHTSHMPTTPAERDCVDCHAASLATFTDFTGGMFDHLVGVNNNCATCHNGVIALPKKVNHIPAQAECSLCHADTTVTGGFAMSTFFTGIHPGLATGCEGCHKTPFFPDPPPPARVKAALTHLPTSQDCRFCHTNVAFTPQIFTHTGITGNCASCHDGSTKNVNAGALGKAQDPTPPHPTTTADCSACHSTTAFVPAFSFDHTGRVANCNECHFNGTATKKPGNHVPTVPSNQDCSVCHVPGTFANAVFNHTGIVNNCSSCHDGSVAAVTVKSVNHLPTTQDCSVCHNTVAFAGAKFDHTGIVNNCVTCHDGVVAKGKHGTHVPTSDDCSVCHLTTGFIPGTFAHVGIVDNCASCHNGVFAQGKKNGHVVTTADCGACHTTQGFIPATFDHSGITTATRCDSCHGVTATGKEAKTNPAHLATNLDCRSCHTTATFVGGTWVHDANTAGICNTCHTTNGGATPQPTTGHFVTTVQCDSCHTTNGWAPANTYVHTPTSNYPGNHNSRKNLTCLSCHKNNTQAVPYPFPDDGTNPPRSLIPECAACHKNDFRRKGDHIGGENGTVYQNRDCSGGGRGCHRVSDNEF